MMRAAWPLAAGIVLAALAPHASGGACDVTPDEREELGLGRSTTSTLVSHERHREVLPSDETFTARVLALASKPGAQLEVEDVLSFDETVTMRCVVHRERDAALEQLTLALALGAPAPSLFALSQEWRALVVVEATVEQRVELTHESMMGFLLLEGADAEDALTRTREVTIEREVELCARLSEDGEPCPQPGGMISASDSIT